MAKTFEERLERLEDIAERMKGNGVPLEEVTSLFEEGVKLARGLEKELAKVEQRIEILINEPSEDQKPELTLFPELEKLIEQQDE